MSDVVDVELEHEHILEAIQEYLHNHGYVEGVGFLKYRFGIVGDPVIMGMDPEACPDGLAKIYFRATFEAMPNVSVMPKRKRKPKK